MNRKFIGINIIVIIIIIAYVIIEINGYRKYFKLESDGARASSTIISVKKVKRGTRTIYDGTLRYSDNYNNDIITTFKTLKVVKEGQCVDIYYRLDSNYEIQIVEENYATKIIVVILLSLVLVFLGCVNIYRQFHH